MSREYQEKFQNEVERIKENEAWIGVDLDGTLAEYHGWTKWNEFGKPIPAMVERVREWLRKGTEVRIFTARVSVRDSDKHVCVKSGEEFTTFQMRNAISDYCVRHIGVPLHSTCVKDLHMIELWDDRAVQVVPNTGRSLAEERDAEYHARHGKAWQSGVEE